MLSGSIASACRQEAMASWVCDSRSRQCPSMFHAIPLLGCSLTTFFSSEGGIIVAGRPKIAVHHLIVPSWGGHMGLVAGISLTIHRALLDNLLAVNPIERL